MPLEPYWVNQKNYVIKRNPSYLEMETGSGRCLFPLIGVYVLLFQEDWLMYSGLAIIVVVWSYSKRWIVDLRNKQIRSTGRILGIPYEDLTKDLSTVHELLVERRSDSQGIGHTYQLRIRFQDGQIATIADRRTLGPLNSIAKEMKNLMPSLALPPPPPETE